MVAPLASFAVSAAMGIAGKAISKAADALDPKAVKAHKTASDFEAMFLEQTLDRMFSSIGDEGPLGDNGTGGSVYRSMLVKEYAGNIVKSGGIGIGDQVFREILRLQGDSSSAS
jgi:Rod binding domain-containing protein